MTQPQQHMIRKQTFECAVPDEQHAWQIQQKIAEVYHEKILPELEILFSQLSDPDTILQFETLEIDVGAVSLAGLEQELFEKVQHGVYEELTNRIAQVHVYTDHQGSSRRHSPNEDRGISQKIRDLEVLQYFLRTGRLPWWAEQQSPEPLENILFRLLETASYDVHLLLKEELPDENARHRLIYQFSDQVLLKVIELFVPEKIRQFQGWINDFNSLYQQTQFISVPEAEFRLLVWDTVLTELLSHHQKDLKEKGVGPLIIQALAQQQNVDVHIFVQSLQKSVEGFSQSFESDLPDFITRLSNEIREHEASFKQGYGEGQAIFSDSRTSPGEPTNERETSLVQTEDPRLGLFEEEVDAIDECYIENAGVVLLWPYLSHFFKHLELLQDGKFVDETSVVRAIHLLQYLATGERLLCKHPMERGDSTSSTRKWVLTEEQGAPEHVLVLNKLLCGWDISKPIAKDFHVSDAEKLESESLLRTVITHWSALKNTSIEGFRTSFLQRNGVVLKQQNNWVVRIERKAYDLLLDRLPWSISIIKLSWMKTLLYVEW